MDVDLRHRGLAAVGAATALALLAACSSGNASEGSETPDADGDLGGTLTLATTSERGLELFTEDFEAETGVAVNGTYAEAGALNEQLRIQITSGTAPDIYRSAPGYAAPSSVLNLANEGVLMDLSDQEWAQYVPESFAPLQQDGDAVYAYPTFGQAILAFYNKDVFEEVGVEPPTTWDELVEVLDELKAAGKVPIALGLADNYVIQFLTYALSATLVNGAEPDFYADLEAGETSFAESAGWRETFEKLMWLIDNGYTTPDPLGMPGDPAMQSVGSGEAAIVVMPSAASPVLAGFFEGGEDRLGSFAFPASDDPEETHIPFSPDYLVVNKDAEHAAAATAFLEYISAPERTAAWAEATGAIPALTNADPVDNDLNRSVQPYLDSGRTTPFANHAWPAGTIADALMTTGQQMVSGSATVDDLLEALDAAYEAASR